MIRISSSASGALELPALQRISGRDVERHPGRGARAAADGDPAADQRAEHGEEPAAGVLDRRGVGAVRGDVAVLVEQVLPRYADVVEHDAAVVDAGQPALVATVRGGDAGQVVALVVADRHHEAVHPWFSPSVVISCAKTAATRGGLGGAADVVLARRRRGGVDDELLGVRVVGRGGLQRLDVAAVPGLGHREAAEQVQVDDLLTYASWCVRCRGSRSRRRTGPTARRP